MFLKKLFIGIVLLFLNASSAFAINYDLRDAKFLVMDTYKTEAFASNDIYFRSKDDEGTKRYYTDTDYMTLLKYEVDVSTGFNAGLYKLSNGKYIIAFGGTTAISRGSSKISSYVDKVQDIITDLNLLNAKKKSNQPYDAHAFFIKMNEDYNFTKDNLTITGHSLGGGLAQYVSYINNDFKAVTFNTAPFPIPYAVDLGEQTNMINIMSNKDELTATLMAVEAIEGRKHDITHAGEMLTPISELLNKWDKTSDHLKYSIAAILATGVNGDGIWKDLTVGMFNNESNTLDFLRAIDDLKAKRIKSAVSNLKKGFGLENEKLTNLMLGKRVVIDTNTGHSMFDMMNASYRNVYGLGLKRIKDTNPEFYKYIDGSFMNDSVPFPKSSNMKDLVASRVLYYFYSKGYDPVLDAKEKLLWAEIEDIQATQSDIENFSKKWLKLDALVAQGIMTVFDPLTSGINLTVKEKERLAGAITDSGKGEFINAVLSKGEADVLDAIESCTKLEIPWFKSVGGMVADTLKQAISEVPKKILECALGQTVQATGRYVNSYKGLTRLTKYNAHRVAHKWLDRSIICGVNQNNQCISEAFGGKTKYDEQLQYIVNDIGAGAGALDWTIRNQAKIYIDEFHYKFVPMINKILSNLSHDVLVEFNHGNRHTNTLDGSIRVVDYDEVENILWINMRVENTSGREIILTSFLPIIISEGVETKLGGNTNDDIFDSFLGQTLAPNENKTFKALPINLGDLKIESKARLALLVDYQSTDGAFKDHMQRFTAFYIDKTEDNMVTIRRPSSQSFGSVYFSLPEGATLEDRVLSASKDTDISFTLGYDAKPIRECLNEAKDDSTYKIWYQDKTTQSSESKYIEATYDKNSQKLTFEMPSEKISIDNISHSQEGDAEESYCGVPEVKVEAEIDDDFTPGESYEECVARGGTEIGCRVGVHKANEFAIGSDILDIEIKDTYMYSISSDDKFNIFDLNNPLNPIQKSSLSFNDLHDMEIIDNHYIYVSHGESISIVNISNPLNVKVISTFKKDNTLKLKKYKNILLCISFSSITMLDISNPLKPSFLATINNNNNRISDAVIKNNILYVSWYRNIGGLLTYDISNLKEIKQLSSEKFDKLAFDIKIYGNYMYLANDWSIKIFDISSNTLPILKKTYKISVREMKLLDKKLYIYSANKRGKLIILDIDDPINPKNIVNIGGIGSLVSKSTSSFYKNYLYTQDNQNIKIIDKSHLFSLGIEKIFTFDGYLASIHTQMQKLYVSNGNDIYKYDITNLKSPLLLVNKKFNSNIIRTQIDNDYLYVLDRSSTLSILDLETLSVIGTVNENELKLSKFISIKDEKLYISWVDNNYDGGFLIIDTKDKASPKVISKFISADAGITFGGYGWDIKIKGDNVYLGNSAHQSIVVDVSDAKNPVYKDYIGEDLKTFAFFDNYMYAAQVGNLNIYELGDSAPKKLTTLNICKDIYKLKVYGNRLFVGCNDKNIILFDIEDPLVPKRIGSLSVTGNLGFDIALPYIYTNTLNGFQVANITDMLTRNKIMQEFYSASILFKLEVPNDFVIKKNKFTKQWIFSEDISNLDIEIISNTYKSVNTNNFTKEGNTLSVELTPNLDLPINKLVLKFTKDGNPVKVSGSDTFWSLTKTQNNHAPKLSDAQVTQMTSISGNPATLEVATHDSDGDNITLSVVDDAGGDVRIEGNQIIASFNDGQSSHTIKVELNDGKESVIQEFTVLTLDQEKIENFYSDVNKENAYFEAIAFGTQKGVIEGDTLNGTRAFRPNDNASLAEVLKIVLKASQKAGFIDVGSSDYYREVYPAWAMPYYTYARDIEAISKETTDLSSIYPTREEIAKIIVKTLGLDNKAELRDENITFSDKVDFSSEEMLYYAKLTKLFGLFMTNDEANPQETIKRGELAKVIKKIFMIPNATLSVSPSSLEYGESVNIIIENKTAQNIDANTHLLYDASDELKVDYIMSGVKVESPIDTSTVPTTSQRVYALLDNNGVKNVVTAPVEMTFTDSDNDYIQDKDDAWKDDARYAYDDNSNGIPDILDSIYGLEDKNLNETISIDGIELAIADIVRDGGYISIDVPYLQVGKEESGTVEKDKFKYYKLEVKAGEHVHVILSGLSSNLDMYIKDIKRPVKSDFDGGPGVSSSQSVYSSGTFQPGTKNEELSINLDVDIELYVGVYGKEAGSFKLNVVKHSDYVKSFYLEESMLEMLGSTFDYYKVHIDHKATVNVKLQSNVAPWIAEESGVMFVKVGSKPTEASYDCRKAFEGKNTYECSVSVPSASDIYLALKSDGKVSAVSFSVSIMDNIKDTDHDGYNDDIDAFPNDPNEWLDTDGDGVGNNTDLDDDNDGISDLDEEKYGLDSLDASDAGKDADGDGASNIDEINAGSNPQIDERVVSLSLKSIDDIYVNVNAQIPSITLEGNASNGTIVHYVVDSSNMELIVTSVDSDVLTLTLVENAKGQANITTTVKAGEESKSKTFSVTVKKPSIVIVDENGREEFVLEDRYDIQVGESRLEAMIDNEGFVEYRLSKAGKVSSVSVNIIGTEIWIDAKNEAKITLPTDKDVHIKISIDGEVSVYVEGALLPKGRLPLGTHIKANDKKVNIRIPMPTKLEF